MTLGKGDRTTLLWMLQTTAWQLSDLIRFARVTEALSEIDSTVLLQLTHKCEDLIKRAKEDHNAIPQVRTVLPSENDQP